MSNPDFATTLKAERERIGIPQAQAAKLLKVSHRIYCDWERGVSVPFEIAQEGALARLRAIPSSVQPEHTQNAG